MVSNQAIARTGHPAVVHLRLVAASVQTAVSALIEGRRDMAVVLVDDSLKALGEARIALGKGIEPGTNPFAETPERVADREQRAQRMRDRRANKPAA